MLIAHPSDLHKGSETAHHRSKQDGHHTVTVDLSQEYEEDTNLCQQGQLY